MAKIKRNKERDREEQRQLAAMGWHCITVWECELTPKKREMTLESIAFTLNHIYLQDHAVQRGSELRVARIKGDEKNYPQMDEEYGSIPIAAEEIADSQM